jgi:ATP-dependent DNA helicase RecQ
MLEFISFTPTYGLAAMVEHRPQSLSEFAELSGVGERKLAAYGEAFLTVIRAHAPNC